MTLRRWITFGSAAALIAVSACSDSGRTAPQGRAGEPPSRARAADAGTSDLRGTGNTGISGSPSATPSTPSSTDTSGASGSASGSASGTTNSTSSGSTSGSTTGGETKK